MVSYTAPGKTEIRFWVTPEAARAMVEVCEGRGTTKPRYIQQVIARILHEHRPDLDVDELLPPASTINDRWRSHPGSLGYKGRWAKWVMVQCTAHASVPLTLTTIAVETGDRTMASLIRRYLAEDLERDFGSRVPMPNSFTGHFAETMALS